MAGPVGDSPFRDLLHRCGLPGAWAGAPQWRIFCPEFGDGEAFLTAWQAWREDPSRPRLLHFISVAPGGGVGCGSSPQRQGRDAHSFAPLASQLAAQWWGLTPGTHRLAFEGGRILLTLHVADPQHVLRAEPFTADSVLLAGEPEIASLRALARHCRRGTAVATAAGHAVSGHGFVDGRFEPSWEPREAFGSAIVTPSRCIVIGAGLAGAAAAAALALRGWQVTVLDAAPSPAAGASGLPVGLLAPHQSPDDNPLSRLSRAGVRLTLRHAAALAEGTDWSPTGVLERDGRLPPAMDCGEAWEPWTRAATPGELLDAGLDATVQATTHEKAAWIRPGALVERWLAEPGVSFLGGQSVAAIRPADGDPGEWRVENETGACIASAPLVVVAAALGSARLLPGLPLNVVRGQVSWGPRPEGDAFPKVPLNGNGHFIPDAPGPEGRAWYSGSTFVRGDTGTEVRREEHLANFARLTALVPAAAQALRPAFERHEVRGWTGIRCVSRDRRPLVGEWKPGLWISCAMGSRGLTFAALCAEILASRLHGEPLPVARALARGLDAGRLTAGD